MLVRFPRALLSTRGTGRRAQEPRKQRILNLFFSPQKRVSHNLRNGGSRVPRSHSRRLSPETSVFSKDVSWRTVHEHSHIFTNDYCLVTKRSTHLPLPFSTHFHAIPYVALFVRFSNEEQFNILVDFNTLLPRLLIHLRLLNVARHQICVS